MSLKLESLNTWGGRLYEPLMDHVAAEAETGVDVFCFQEVCTTTSERSHTDAAPDIDPAAPVSDEHASRADLYKQLCNLLPEFQAAHRVTQTGIDFNGPVGYDLQFGLASFVRPDLQVVSEGDTFVFGEFNAQQGSDCATMGRNMQFTTFEYDGQQVTAANLHGLWTPDGKGDTPDRLVQSRKVVDFLAGIDGEVILCGDMNLQPDTDSIRMLERAGLRNLVTEYGVQSTRSIRYNKPTRYGSYMFTSSGIKVEDFRAIEVDVSDHLPLQITCTTE
jgi:endonuclease/exonuclease/phosphatase family metal-dependent hydrolase